MRKRLLTWYAVCALAFPAAADDYTFQLNFANATPDTEETLDNGSVFYTFAAGTDLDNLGMTATVPDGATVTPDPSTAKIRDCEPEIFTVKYADGTLKAFPYYFSAGRWFTAVLFGDPEILLTSRTNNNATAANLTNWAEQIVSMGESGRYAFTTNTWVKPAADIVICMGDMDGDSESSGDDIEAIFDIFTAANIPFITMCGNHDLVPDYWDSTDSTLGVTFGLGSGGQDCDTLALGMVTRYLNTAASNGIENVERFTQNDGGVQAEPFTFTFKGVRFYVGQTYWFQKTYDMITLANYIAGNTTATYYAPNDVISSLTDFVAEHTDDPSIWIQHYPINCEDRWWLDQNSYGDYVEPSNTADYSTADKKRNKYEDLITQTTNPYHFAGHNHTEAVYSCTYNDVTFKEYIAPYFATRGSAFMVLCHEGEGVKEVQTVYFDY